MNIFLRFRLRCAERRLAARLANFLSSHSAITAFGVWWDWSDDDEAADLLGSLPFFPTKAEADGLEELQEALTAGGAMMATEVALKSLDGEVLLMLFAVAEIQRIAPETKKLCYVTMG